MAGVLHQETLLSIISDVKIENTKDREQLDCPQDTTAAAKYGKR